VQRARRHARRSRAHWDRRRSLRGRLPLLRTARAHFCVGVPACIACLCSAGQASVVESKTYSVCKQRGSPQHVLLRRGSIDVDGATGPGTASRTSDRGRRFRLRRTAPQRARVSAVLAPRSPVMSKPERKITEGVKIQFKVLLNFAPNWAGRTHWHQLCTGPVKTFEARFVHVARGPTFAIFSHLAFVRRPGVATTPCVSPRRGVVRTHPHRQDAASPRRHPASLDAAS
jgi:hypothetical protein